MGIFDAEVSFILFDYDGNIVYQDLFLVGGICFPDSILSDCLKPVNVKDEMYM